jgi:tetratricopeptide (TPR) repeat protein
MRSALKSLERAIELDSAYALAHAWLGLAWFVLTNDFAAVPHLEGMPRAKSAALRALELDDALAEAHAALGVLALYFDWDWPASEGHYRSALELNPNLPLAHTFALHLTSRGRHDEAIAEGRRAVELDPLNLRVRALLAQYYFYARRYDDSLEEARKILEMDPTFHVADRWVGHVYGAMGRYAEQIEASERGEVVTREVASAFRGVLSREGPKGYLREVLAFARAIPLPHHSVAGLHAQLGERDEAFAQLDRAFAARESYLVSLRVQPQFDPIRDDPRFHDLVRRIGIPEG